MKPRPTISTFAIAMRPGTTLQCRRNAHIRSALSYHVCQDASRITEKQALSTSQLRHASTSTSAAKPSSSTYGREAPPPAKLRPNKTNVPAKGQKPTKSTSTPTTTTTHSTHLSKPQRSASRQPNELLNPPDFTYAPPLSIPSREPDQSYPSYLWKCGRAYLSFYKASVSNVRQTAALARSLRSKSAGTSGSPTDILSRAEWQITLRSRNDMLRLPAFGIIFLVFGEWTPLLVMYITPAVPEVCRIPRQVERVLAKSEQRRFERLRRNWLASSALCESSGALANLHVNDLDMLHVRNISARLDCHARVWDWLNLPPPGVLVKWSVGRRVEYLKRDDELIKRDGGWKELGEKEVHRACVERGIDVLGKKEGVLRGELGRWFGEWHGTGF